MDPSMMEYPSRTVVLSLSQHISGQITLALDDGLRRLMFAGRTPEDS